MGSTIVSLLKTRNIHSKYVHYHVHLGLIFISNDQDSPIFQLQATFAALQAGKQRVFNPLKLVESLKLRTNEQQDAQEFVNQPLIVYIITNDTSLLAILAYPGSPSFSCHTSTLNSRSRPTLC